MLKDLAFRFLSNRLGGSRAYGPGRVYDPKKAAKAARKRARDDADRQGWHDGHYTGRGKGYVAGPYAGKGDYTRTRGTTGFLVRLLLSFLGRRR